MESNVPRICSGNNTSKESAMSLPTASQECASICKKVFFLKGEGVMENI